MSDKAFKVKNGLVVNTNLIFANNGQVGVNTATPSTTFHIVGTDGIVVPIGNTAQQPATVGTWRYNTDTQSFEGLTAAGWTSLGSGGGQQGLTYIAGSNLLEVTAANFQGAPTSWFGNSTVNSTFTNTSLTIANSTQTVVFNPSLAVFGNSTVNAVVNSSSYVVANSTSTLTFNPSSLTTGNTTVNTTQITLGNSSVNVAVNSTAITTPTGSVRVGSATVNVVVNSTLIAVANSTTSANLTSSSLTTGNTTVNSTQITLGNTSVNAVINSTFIVMSNGTLSANYSLAGLTNGNTTVNSTCISIGNSSVNVFINSSSILLNGNPVLLNGTTQTVNTGFTITAFNQGTLSAAGTLTVDPTVGNYQYFNANGAFTFAAPSSDCAVDFLMTNGTAAGTVTFSGFTVGTTGDALDTTNGHQFLISVRRINGVSLYLVKALQ